MKITIDQVRRQPGGKLEVLVTVNDDGPRWMTRDELLSKLERLPR